VGLLEWGIKHDLPQQANHQHPGGTIKMPGWLKVFLPG
jgi:hypothetical protein